MGYHRYKTLIHTCIHINCIEMWPTLSRDDNNNYRAYNDKQAKSRQNDDLEHQKSMDRQLTNAILREKLLERKERIETNKQLGKSHKPY